MAKDDVEALIGVLSPLLRSLEALGYIGRYLHPPDFAAVMQAAGTPDADLREALPALADWPERLTGVRERLQVAGEEALAAFGELRDATDVRSVYRALRHTPRAQEALFPLADGLDPVSRYFLDSDSRKDGSRQEVLDTATAREDVGVFHLANATGARGGYSLYVPEDYTPGRALPLVMALHGGGGHGRAFLWSWLRDARGQGAILAAPTSVGDTWALQGADVDTPNLLRILAEIQGTYSLDPERLLLTGMSDGGTFSYVSGLEPGSPFTHLAPIASAFHPMMAQMADPGRMKGLPIHVTHGVLDWMFPVDMARQAQAALTSAGAQVTYREIDDLSHTYPREVNLEILRWLHAR